MSAETNPLSGTRILVLEDELLVSMMLEDMLGDLERLPTSVLAPAR